MAGTTTAAEAPVARTPMVTACCRTAKSSGGGCTLRPAASSHTWTVSPGRVPVGTRTAVVRGPVAGSVQRTVTFADGRRPVCGVCSAPETVRTTIAGTCRRSARCFSAVARASPWAHQPATTPTRGCLTIPACLAVSGTHARRVAETPT
ncbi:hypothetical protein GCM10010378_04200 [Streptomyces viridochromogenes]